MNGWHQHDIVCEEVPVHTFRRKEQYWLLRPPERDPLVSSRSAIPNTCPLEHKETSSTILMHSIQRGIDYSRTLDDWLNG